MTDSPSIPVCRPLLPTHDRLEPYLRRLDEQRWYSNFGPLNNELTDLLAKAVGTSAERVVTAANATAALTCAMMDLAPVDKAIRPRALMPSWTFVATPQAAVLAGFEPYFADVDAHDWQMTPAIARSAIAASPEPVALIVTVGAFGAPVDVPAWEAFAEETGLPVIVDAAAGFDSARASRLTTVVSLHATKSLPAGEGAFVICRDEEEAAQMKRRQNFGFYGSRTATVAALNAKMSEYHAAVGLAALAEWPARRARYAAAIMHYRSRLPSNRVLFPAGFGTEWISATMCVALPVPAKTIADALRAENIETRAWWAEGCHLHPAFENCPRTELPNTAALARSTLGLPISLDITAAEIDRVATVITGLMD